MPISGLPGLYCPLCFISFLLNSDLRFCPVKNTVHCFSQYRFIKGLGNVIIYVQIIDELLVPAQEQRRSETREKEPVKKEKAPKSGREKKKPEEKQDAE